jgi:hypothetical protein
MAQLAEQRRKATPVRVHMASHPTFTRYVFDIPEQTSVSADRAKERLTLSFDTPLAFDLTDAEADLPPVVASINAETEQDLSLVRFSFMAPVRSADLPRWQKLRGRHRQGRGQRGDTQQGPRQTDTDGQYGSYAAVERDGGEYDCNAGGRSTCRRGRAGADERKARYRADGRHRGAR